MFVLMSGLLALSVIDVEHLTLPKQVVYPTLFLVTVLLVLAASVTSDWHRLIVALICALAWFTFFLAINLMSPRYLGFGDVRLAAILGVGLGWFGVRYVILGFFAGNLFGAVIGLALISTKKISRDGQLPYGVFLAMGAAAAIFAGPELLIPFHRLTL